MGDIALSGTGSAGEDLLCVNFHLKQKKTTTHAKGFKRMPRNSPVEVATITDEMRAAAPDRLDWVEKGGTSAVKDQGGCGSCWAFSATQGIESAGFMSSGSLPPALSTQQIISCDKVDLGCSGGDIKSAWDYVKQAGGLDTNEDYPDTSKDTDKSGTCKVFKQVVKVTDAAFAVPPCDGEHDPNCNNVQESDLMAALNSFGPLSVCINADWNNYRDGILTTTCTGKYWDLDHCVQLVGYDTTGETSYWKVKNSWQARWGEDGYIRLPMGTNACGIADEAMYVTAELVTEEVTV